MRKSKQAYRVRKNANSVEKQKRELATRKKVLVKMYPRGIAHARRVKTSAIFIVLEMGRVFNSQPRLGWPLRSFLNRQHPVRMAAVYALMISRKKEERNQFIDRCASIIEAARKAKLSNKMTSDLITIQFGKWTKDATKPSQSEEQGNT